MTSEISVERCDGQQARARASEIWPVYDEVFGDHGDEREWRERTFDPHSRRDGFVLAVARDELDVVLGFAWAYVGERGQWFSDRAAEALGDAAGDWVGGHLELVELAVVESRRRRGVAGRLHDLVLADRGDRPGLLATDAHDSPAVRLYEARGWLTLAPFTPHARLMGLPAPPD